MAGAGSTRTRSGLVVVLLLVPGEVPVVDTTRTNTQASFDADDLRKATVGSAGLRRFPVHRLRKEERTAGLLPRPSWTIRFIGSRAVIPSRSVGGERKGSGVRRGQTVPGHCPSREGAAYP